MVDPNTRNTKRTPVTLKIKFKSETLEQFIERYAVDVSQGGIFIRTKDPLAVGTQMKFEFQLKDASPLIAGEGTVVWTRENDPSRPAIAPGMGVRFDKLGDGSQSILERILADKARQQPTRPQHETTKPPLFTDTPTRVAPAPVAGDQLLAGAHGSGIRKPPLSSPNQPMPFHSDADDFDERAFEEQTKVRSLEELAQQAQAAGDAFDNNPFDAKTATSIIPPDELALRRAQARGDATLSDQALPPEDDVASGAAAAAVGAEPMVPAAPAPAARSAGTTSPPRESAPSLPSPPSPPEPMTRSQPAPRLLDTSPSPRTEAVGGDSSAKTKLGLEPARVDTSMRSAAAASHEPAFTRGRASAPSVPPMDIRPSKKPSSAPMIIGAIALVAAVATAVWFFVLKDNLADTTPTSGPTGGGSALASANPGGSAGSGSAPMMESTEGSAGSAGSAMAAVKTPAGPRVATVIAVSGLAPGATVAIDDQTGALPFTAQLEKGKSYTAHVTAPGFVGLDVPVIGGVAPAGAKLVAKPRTLTVASDPPGAIIYVEGTPTGKLTPADVDLKAFAGRTKLRVSLRKGGYRPFETTFDMAGATESADKVTATMPSATLAVAPVVVQPRPPVVPHPPQQGSGDTGTTGTGGPVTSPDGSGAAGTGTGGTTDTPKQPESGSNTVTPPPSTPTPPTAGSAEPEPDFTHQKQP
nr:TIGR02266 family protein [Kofleriaceae bacterium]